MTMDPWQAWLALFFAALAGMRLVMFNWHVRRDVKWLAETFGAAPNDEQIARKTNLFWAAINAMVALAIALI